MLVQEVTHLDIVGYLETLKRRGLSPRTVKGRFGTLRFFFEWATSWELVAQNPTARLKTPRAPLRRKGFVSREQYESILDICPMNEFLGARRQAVFRLLLSSGIRLNELINLNLDDLDGVKGQVRVIYGKGQKERNVPYVRDAQQAMNRYLHFRGDGMACLWVTEERGRLSYRQMQDDIRVTMVRAGIDIKDKAHAFRRTWAANAVRSGIPRPYVQAIAGWSTPTMMDRYTEAMQGEEQALEAFRNFDPWG